MMRRIGLGLLIVILGVALLPPLGAWIFQWGPNPDALPLRGSSVRIGKDLKLNVLDFGSGSPVVLVHGLPSSATDWAATPQTLAAKGHRVIAYDRAGFGYSSRPAPTADRYTYESNAQDLAALLDTLGIQRAALVGWSYGGAVVQTFARQAPERVSHLVLVAAVGPAQPDGTSDPLGLILHSGLGTPILQWVSAIPPLALRMTHDNLVAAFGREAAIPQGWTEYTMAMLALPGTLRSFVLEEQRGNAAALQPEALRMPALVLQGTDDRLVPAFVGEDLHRRLPGSQLVMVPDGSHMLPVTHTELVAEQIHTFLTEPHA